MQNKTFTGFMNNSNNMKVFAERVLCLGALAELSGWFNLNQDDPEISGKSNIHSKLNVNISVHCHCPPRLQDD